MNGVSESSCEVITFSGGGRTRRYRLHRSELPENAPLLIELHGSGLGAAQQMRTSGLCEKASARGFVVAAPEAVQPLRLAQDWPEGTAWNVPGAPLLHQKEVAGDGPDESASIQAMLGDLQARVGFDPLRVYLVGYSGGARLASHLVFALPGTFAAMAAVSGLRNPGIEATGVVPPVISFHGRKDALNPFEGGAGARWQAGVRQTADELAQRMGCSDSASVAEPCAGVQTWTYRDEAGRVRLVQYVLQENGHAWPGSPDPEHQRMFGPDEAGIDASELIMDFFMGSAPGS